MKKKNLVLIMCDQLRKVFLGCYGNECVNTPNIDSLAAHSTVFDHCYVNNPICMPSRMSIFTGLYPHNHNQWTNGNQLEHPLRTLADHLHDNGYHTGSIGKLHFQCTDCGKNAPHISMEDHRLWEERGDNIDWYGPYWGFEHVEFTSGHATKPLAHYGKWYHEHGGKDEWAIAKPVEGFDACPVTTMPENLHDSMFVGERAAAYISEHANGDQPFFLTASFPDPHHPFNPPLETALRYKDVPVKMPVNEDDDLHTRPRHYHYHQYGVWHRAGLLHPLPDMPEEDKEKCGKCADQIAQFMDEKILQGLGLLTHGDSSGEEYKLSVLSAHERDQRIVHRGGRPYIASFAKAVFEGRRLGDKACEEIFQRQAALMADLTYAAQTSFDGDFNVVAGGGIVSHYPEYFAAIKEKSAPGAQLVLQDAPPAYGAAVEAMWDAGESVTDGFKTRFLAQYAREEK